MSKTIIIQVSVGNTYGYIYRSDESPKAKEASTLFEKHCITSVKRYCEKYNQFDLLLNLLSHPKR